MASLYAQYVTYADPDLPAGYLMRRTDCGGERSYQWQHKGGCSDAILSCRFFTKQAVAEDALRDYRERLARGGAALPH
ncbi:hypothetical protein LCGC14_3140440 [marine sediment metagenome]|uniref:Uncharacterized protein n=1 Tax=marine sediment metagenome TaxID=412755 RepID=A0A0F8VX61_9ZZZZ